MFCHSRCGLLLVMHFSRLWKKNISEKCPVLIQRNCCTILSQYKILNKDQSKPLIRFV